MLKKIISNYKGNYKTMLKLCFIYLFGISIGFCLLMLFANKISSEILLLAKINTQNTNINFIGYMMQCFFGWNIIIPIIAIVILGGATIPNPSNLDAQTNTNLTLIFFVWLSLILSYFLCQTILLLFTFVNNV